LGSNVIAGLRVPLIEVDKLGFLLLVLRIILRLIVGFFGFTISFIGITYTSRIISKVYERKGGTTGPRLMSNVLKADLVVASAFVFC